MTLLPEKRVTIARYVAVELAEDDGALLVEAGLSPDVLARRGPSAPVVLRVAASEADRARAILGIDDLPEEDDTGQPGSTE